MSFDSLTYQTTAKELNKTLVPGRIERIAMPDKNNILLYVRCSSAAGRESKVLLVSADPSRPRIHIAEVSAASPLSAFSFLMHLRKHIGGGMITEIASLPRERAIAVSIEGSDELGYKKNYVLYVEPMGRYPNVILADGEGKITDSLRHVTPDEFSARAVIPGLKYAPPPAQENKVSPDDEAAIRRVFDEYPGGKASDYLMSRVYGYAPATMKQLVFSAFGTLAPDGETMRGGAELFLKAVKALDEAYDPCVTLAEGKIRDVFVAPFTYEEREIRRYPSLSAAMDAYFSQVLEAGEVSGRAANLEAAIKAAAKKTAKSLAVYREQALSAADRDDYRVRGELLTANLFRVRQGMASVTVDNYYTGEKTEIALDPTLSPQKNAQRYFRLYSKKKTTLEKSTALAAEAEERLDYLDSLLASLSVAETDADYAEIAAEAEAAGLIKKSKRRAKSKPSRPIELEVKGFKVAIGKNNTQNDALVRSGEGGWLWLHTQKIHGSHGIIKASSVPQDVINEVAAYVAHYSKASMSANVPVDYTLLKFVKKPSGAVPGKVIYTHQQTVNVTPKKPDSGKT